MGIQLVPPERFAELEGESRRERLAQPAPALKNQAAVAAVHRSGTFVFRGREYLVPPLPYQAGVDLQLIAQRMKALRKEVASPAGVVEGARQFNELARIFRGNCRPRSLWRRLLWPLTPNPFRRASQTEVGQLHDFFWQCQTRSSVRCFIALDGSDAM